MSLRILCILIVAVIGTQAFPQQRRRPSDSESPDFNFDGKPGEKTHRSLDQVQYQDGVNRGRSTFKDSYGNPVAYDSLDDVDAQKPSKNKDNPFMYIIPGYAGGILQPHELPARNAEVDDATTARRINDDRIHFIDPLNPNQFQSSDKFPSTPSTSLSVPGIIDNSKEQVPIDIPRPNIDLQETPEAPIIDDPIDHVPPHPPQDVFLNTSPSTTLEVPINQDANTRPLFQDLVPPQIPNSNDGSVEIPKPNLFLNESPIDTSNDNPLNIGLLPPPSTSTSIISDQQQTSGNTISFTNQNTDGPVIITDDQTVFAPKPANGLLPPKEPTQNDIDFQSKPLSPTADTPKFTGSITTRRPTPPQTSLFIPVQVIQTPGDRPNFIQPPKTNNDKINRFNFGGAPGILSSGNQDERVVPTQIASIPLAPSTNDRFSGTFGGAPGILSSNDSNNDNFNPASTSQTFTQVPKSDNNELTLPKKTFNKNNFNFGGSAGVLSPNDNV